MGETIRYDEVGWLNNLALGWGRRDERSRRMSARVC